MLNNQIGIDKVKKYSYCTRVIILIAIFLFQCRPFCFADKIRLKNGSTFEGTVLQDDNDMLLIEVEGGTIAFHKNEIASVEKENLGQQESNDIYVDKAKFLSESEYRDMANKIIYKVIDTEKSESPLKVMITSSIIVSTNIKENVLRQILEKAIKETSVTTSNYKQSIKQSVVYAYLSEKTYKIDKSAWVGKAFWIIGTDDIKIDINKDKLESAYQEASLNQEKFIQTGKDYPGVFGPDGEFRTKAILPFEKRVHDALKREFDLNPEPKRHNYSSNEEWIRACDKVENICVAKIAKEFNIDEKTVDHIWGKVEILGH